MKTYKIAVTLLAVSIFCLSFLQSKTVKYCGKEYIEKPSNEYLKDEKIKTLSMGVMDKKTKKPVFGYIVSAIRNDTNFIYTKFSYVGDTIFRKIYYDYKISRGKDSVISKFICKKDGLYFYSLQTYWNGEQKKIEFPNRML